MSRTGGEGRSHNERSQRVITPAQVRKAERERELQEEREWAEKCGPVTVRRVER